MANKSINTLDNTSTLDNADLLVLWKASANAAYSISGQDFVAMLTALASGHGGIASIDPTSTVGLVDTYTITYADGNTGTFTVTNGAQGPQGDQTYVWIAYSAVSPTSDADVSVIPGPWIGFYVGLESTQGNLHYTDYTWYEFKGPKGDGVAYTVLSSTVGLTKTYTMYTEDGTAVGTFTVTDGSGAVSTVNGIGADGNGDVPVTVGSVEDLELNGTPLVSGSATIEDAYNALQVKQVLICPATEFTSTELPLYNGNRVNDGTIEIVKGYGTDGWIELHGRQSGAGDWRMFFTSADIPTGTWIRSDLVPESGTPSATSGTLLSSATIRRSGNVVTLVYGATGVSIPTTSSKVGSVPSKFAPSHVVYGAALVGFGGVCYASVQTNGDIEIRGATAQTNQALRFQLTWTL